MEKKTVGKDAPGNCRERCPFAQINTKAEGIDDCSGKSLRYAEMLRHMPHVRPVCLLLNREVTWDGEVLDVPADISERAKAARSAQPEAWNERFEAEIAARGARMADYVHGVSSFTMDSPTERPDIEGWNLAVALELRAFLNPLTRHGLSDEEAAEHFHRVHSQRLAEQITDGLVLDQSYRPLDEQ